MVNTENTNNVNEAVMRFPFLFIFLFFFYYSIHLYPLTSSFLFFKLMQLIKITQSDLRNWLRNIFLPFFLDLAMKYYFFFFFLVG